MPGERLLRILALLRAGATHDSAPARLCEVAAEAVAVNGAGVMLMADDLPRGSVCSSNPVSQLIEDLQFTLGEGPCIDAYRQDSPVLEADLAGPAAHRWIAFAAPALAAGARAVFGFPLSVGVVRLGALNLYTERPGALSDDQHRDALVMADVAARAVLWMQAEAPVGTMAAELETGSNFHFLVHQAAGMVSAQADISVTEALVRLRAYAFARNRGLNEVAADVVARQVRFE
jgi:hypothetical protein